MEMFKLQALIFYEDQADITFQKNAYQRKYFKAKSEKSFKQGTMNKSMPPLSFFQIPNNTF